MDGYQPHNTKEEITVEEYMRYNWTRPKYAILSQQKIITWEDAGLILGMVTVFIWYL